MYLRRSFVRGLPAQRGETLLELLVTLVLMGTGIAAILGGLLSLTQTTESVRASTEADVLVQSYAEQLEQPVDPTIVTPGPNAYGYIPCGTPAQYQAQYPYVVPTSVTQTPNLSVKVVQVLYLSQSPSGSGSSGDQTGYNNVCPSGGDEGLQRIYIEAFDKTDNVHPDKELVVIVKRNENCPALQLTPTTVAGPANYPDPGPC